MNVIDYFDPKGEKYYEENGEVRRRFFKFALRKIETPFHWQFAENRNTEYNGEFIKMSTRDFRFEKNVEDKLRRTQVVNDDGKRRIDDPDDFLEVLERVVFDIEEFHENPEMVIFYDLSIITFEMDQFPLLVSYAIV